MRTFKIIPIAIFGLGLSACSSVDSSAHTDAPALSSLTGSEWGVAEHPEQFIQFQDKSQFIGNGGCNNFFGTYTQNEGKLGIGPIGATKMACPELSSEQAFFQALEAAETFDATHLELKLYDESGKLLLSLQRRDWD